ncbi:hypothetical protein HDV00_009664 [Rhizophlyctis rosea]|nr:hypothetical protein HDV00_009664 [Rhizophlyctis rosea]
MHPRGALLVVLFLISFVVSSLARLIHPRFPLISSPSDLKSLASLSEISTLSTTSTNSFLAPLLIPRVSGTENNTFVQNYIKSNFNALNWHVELDSFKGNTPYGEKEFTNIIVTKDPYAKRKLVLAAHFDSKYFAKGEFIGATDSAAPCAILIDLAHALNPLLDSYLEKHAPTTPKSPAENANPPTIQIIFFDGEEAFVNWSASDSVYGSRHLATKWSNTYGVASGGPPFETSPPLFRPTLSSSVLAEIDVFVLLDLLGTADDVIPNQNLDTTWMWDRIVDIQSRLAKANLLSPHITSKMNILANGTQLGEGYFVSAVGGGGIDDDHRPFRQHGVPIVHCITSPFPRVWHTLEDNADALSVDTVRDYSLIFRTLVVEYLGLPVGS